VAAFHPDLAATAEQIDRLKEPIEETRGGRGRACSVERIGYEMETLEAGRSGEVALTFELRSAGNLGA
jgi:hypothetical protein